MKSCEKCRFRGIYDKNPESVLGRIWKWHIGWCPGWKSYLKSLPDGERDQLLKRYSHYNIFALIEKKDQESISGGGSD